MAPSTPRRPFLSLRWKLVLGFTLVFTLVFTLAYYWFYFFSTEQAIDRIRVELQDTILGAAAGLDSASLTRLFEEGTVNAAGFSDHPDYAAQLAWFETVQSLEQRAWPYTYVAGPEPDQIVALADLWALHDPSKAYGFRELDRSTGPLVQGLRTLSFNVPRQRRCEMARGAYPPGVVGAVRGQLAYAGCTILRRVGYEDAHGSWVSAYAPVVDEAGRSVGGLGLDFEMDYVDEVQDAILARTVQAFTITYLTLLLLVLLMARVLTQPIARLTAIAERIGDGQYEQDFDLRQGRWRDEIGMLAEVFAGMAAKVGERERTLRHEVMQLQIEIDESKRTQEVQAIVDTDFFRELQDKARQFRSRASKGGDATAPVPGRVSRGEPPE